MDVCLVGCLVGWWDLLTAAKKAVSRGWPTVAPSVTQQAEAMALLSVVWKADPTGALRVVHSVP